MQIKSIRVADYSSGKSTNTRIIAARGSLSTPLMDKLMADTLAETSTAALIFLPRKRISPLQVRVGRNDCS